MISHKHKFIFIHIRSTGGTSIKGALGRALPQYSFILPKYNPHMSIGNVYNRYNYDEVRDYFKFAFIRNPWDRLVSRYYFLMRKFPKNNFTFEEWLRGSDFKGNQRAVIRAKSVQQLDYVTIGDEIAVDYIGKFENIQEDFNIITEKIGIDRIELPKLNQTEHRPYKEYYTNELVELVAEWFKDDIAYFNYFWGDQ